MNQLLSILTKKIVWNPEFWFLARTRGQMDPNRNGHNVGVMSGHVLNPLKHKMQNGAHTHLNPQGDGNAPKSCLPTINKHKGGEA